MALPTQENLKALDYAYMGQPFCYVAAKSGIVLAAMDYVYMAQPFVANQDSGILSKVVDETITYSIIQIKALARIIAEGITFASRSFRTNYEVISEALTMADNTRKRISLKAFNNVITVSASVTSRLTFFKVLVESVTLTATLSRLLTIMRNFLDYITLSIVDSYIPLKSIRPQITKLTKDIAPRAFKLLKDIGPRIIKK